MSKVLESVDQRTKLVGENRLELLLFKINSTQLFAINVFKVREVVKLPALNALPGSHPHITGIANIRGNSIPVINLKGAIGFKPMEMNANANLIITEYNRSVQGFLVGEVEHIVNMTWNDILPPPKTAGANHYLTAITRLEGPDGARLVSIIDVEKVLAEIIHYDVEVSDEVLASELTPQMAGKHILIADDSATARRQVKDTLEPLGVKITEVSDGRQALKLLQQWAAEGKTSEDDLLMLITDAEMPEMDGYKLTHELRQIPELKDLYIVLNTSLSGNFNNAMAEKVGCNQLISKFQPDNLVRLVHERIKMLSAEG
ncbi:chemotaxis protein CheW [Shewanella sp. NFH-SH190041]|uniref:chemotaxis protein CheV n=1 Tax=Shewanella sp. NFH-SH190041 TaxID=2950245 RepID=UPI0021C2CF51|nr:chemotaxis protein CheV [Shewanella sp. NFH-SH190041]BDM64643.1 chemotaxis protein CheW [Shewanella sp. NFH-SH190041]